MCVFSRSVSSPRFHGCAGRCSPSAPSALPPSAPCPWMPSGTRDPQRSYGEREGGEGSVYVCVHGIIYVFVQMCICVHGCVFVCEHVCVCVCVCVCVLARQGVCLWRELDRVSVSMRFSLYCFIELRC